MLLLVMPEPLFLGDITTPRRSDPKWIRWTKMLGVYQNRPGAIAENNPRRSDGIRVVKEKLLSAIRLNTGTGSSSSSSSPPVSALVAWYKTETLSLSDGAPVSQWNDSSGNGNHLTQATAGKRPIFKAVILNDRDVVRFSAANDTCLINTTPSGFGSTGITIYAVMKAITWATFGMVVVCNPGGVELRLLNTQSLYGWLSDGVLDHTSSSGEGAGPWAARILRARFNNAANTVNLKLSGITEPLAGSNTTTPTYPQICLGARDNADTTLNLDGDIGEILIYTGEIDAAQRTEVEDYLLDRWGMAM